MTSLADAWGVLTGPRVEDSWVEVIHVVAVPPPPVNIVTGDSVHFEGGTVGDWTAGGSAPPTITNSAVRANDDGVRSMLVTWASGGSFDNANLEIDTVVGHTYTATAYAWVPTGSPAAVIVIGGHGFGGSTGAAFNMWSRIEVSWTADDDTSQVQVWPTSAPSAGQQVWLDQFFVYDHDDGRPDTFEERVAGRLDGVTGCRVEHNVNAQIRGGCSLSLRDVGQDLDWASVRFRPWVRVNNLTWPLGVFLPASPSLSHDEFGSAWDVPCLDKTSILDQDVMTSSYSVLAGAVVTDQVAELIAGAGESSVAITPSTLTTRSPQTWEPGTSRLRIINDLLDGINYFSLWADRRGLYRAEPYRRPQDRSLAATFAAGEAAIHSPRWSRAQDIAGVPNRVVLVVEGDEDTPGMTATADNTDPASPYSIPSRGRVVARTYTGVEAADQPTLDALAARYLADASTPSATLEVQHASVPLDGNDVVRFASAGVDTLAVVEGWQVDLTPGSLMTGNWREVVSS